MEDVKKILYSGAKRAIINYSKSDSEKMIIEAAQRFGKEKIAVSINDFDTLFKHQNIVDEFSSEIVFMHRVDWNSVMSITDTPCVVLTDTTNEKEIKDILK